MGLGRGTRHAPVDGQSGKGERWKGQGRKISEVDVEEFEKIGNLLDLVVEVLNIGNYTCYS